MLRSNLALGLGLALSLLGIGFAAVHWAKALMNDHEKSEERHPQRSSDENRAGAVAALKEGAADSAIGRRGVLQGAMISALALFPLAIVVPFVGNIGDDWNVSKFRHTMWRKGTKLATDPTGRPIKAADVTIGSVFHVIPEDLHEAEHPLDEKAKAVVLLVRLDPADLTEAEDRKGWSYDGIVAYSKICTHVGCPVALYEQQTHHLLCPCHQSTFDVADGAKVVFGPAKRPLPQLPITVDDEGYLIAQSDFTEPVGPSYWERLK
jgi:ubiquinol-cytochrome c reductase iron-sulfur subunit